jgi:hypothetical protein
VLFWFILGFEKKPIWEGTGLLFLIALSSIFLVAIITPRESEQTLAGFYKRCRPPFGWKKYKNLPSAGTLQAETSMGYLLISSAFGILACFGLAMATNAIFIQDWLVFILGISGAALFGYFLIRRSLFT